VGLAVRWRNKFHPEEADRYNPESTVEQKPMGVKSQSLLARALWALGFFRAAKTHPIGLNYFKLEAHDSRKEPVDAERPGTRAYAARVASRMASERKES